jgi:peroxiredoxin
MREIAVPAVGEPAPDFALRRWFDDIVTLSDLRRRGPVVVAFYVFDFGEI